VANFVRKDTNDRAHRKVGQLCAATLAGALMLLAPAAATAASTQAPASPSTPAAHEPSTATVATLSNLTTLTRWAYPQTASPAHARPSAHSRIVGHLQYLTTDGQADVYLALRSYTIGRNVWIQVPLPGRPNGRTGWVISTALGELHEVHQYLRINRERLRATLYRDGHAIFNAPVGVGRPSLPTPAGHFYVTEKLLAIGGPVYGPFALGTSAYAPSLSEWPGGGVVGIHGTNEPQLIPGRPSHGCIRLRNADITRLWRLAEVGTPIEIV
jgi:lipoprotein-anchoring transpeptidase ErfK/SrfK